jgi:hypothetical protein
MIFPSQHLHIGVPKFEEARKEGEGTFTASLNTKTKKLSKKKHTKTKNEDRSGLAHFAINQGTKSIDSLQRYR